VAFLCQSARRRPLKQVPGELLELGQVLRDDAFCHGDQQLLVVVYCKAFRFLRRRFQP
jgi:hypothetical protein